AINFDNAATTPPLKPVLESIINFSPWYSSIHRGTGYKSKLSSFVYDNARYNIIDFVGANPNEDTVIFSKNATEALNKLSYRLLSHFNDGIILSSSMEHHSNDLPWRSKYKIDYIEVNKQGQIRIDDLENKLKKYQGKVKLITITGASNVTGLINPIHDIARLAHLYNAKIAVDGSQLIPHMPVKMRSNKTNEHIDFLAFSAHKMYAPFGIGVLVGPKSYFLKGSPEYSGGGTVKVVTKKQVIWDLPPNKEEAGTPNIMGVVALETAIKALKNIGMSNILKQEKILTNYTLLRLKEISDIIIYGNPDNSKQRVGIIPFNIENIPHQIVAQALSNESAIAVRSGCFCAQPYVQKLLNINSKQLMNHLMNPEAIHPGLVRISFGFYNTIKEVDILIDKLHQITKNKDVFIKKYSNK
ncbi:MAG: aminotransferase class V-fold PLP-dependent enzyme, partial [Eubacteriales bacterium]